MERRNILFNGIKKRPSSSKTYTYMFSTTLPVDDIVKFIKSKHWSFTTVVECDSFGPDAKWKYDEKFVLGLFDELRIINIVYK